MNVRVRDLPVTVRRRMKSIALPVQYEEGCRDLEACLSINESKLWSDRADALAGWAKIYKSDRAARGARILKLHAYRRMGELATELRPAPKDGRFTQQNPGPQQLLRKHGLDRHEAKAAHHLARFSPTEFAELTSRRKPPSPTGIEKEKLRLSRGHVFVETMQRQIQLLFYCRRAAAAEVAALVEPRDAPIARERARELIEWLDEFEARLAHRAS